jgi:predicted lipoprotein with Yx(FWY)xxD motif
MTSIRLVPAILSALLALTSASAMADPVMKKDGVLVNAAGMTVYTFDKDVANSGKSACAGPCLALWPAVSAGDTAATAPYSVVVREDGSKQLAYKGKPLYVYSGDKKAGERTGDNFKNVWHVVAD